VPLLLENCVGRSRSVCLTLVRTPLNSSVLQYLDQCNERFVAIKEFQSNAAYLPITGAYETYLGSLHKKFRTNLRRWQRKIDQLAEVEYVSVRGEQATAGNKLTDFMEMEAIRVEGDAWGRP